MQLNGYIYIHKQLLMTSFYKDSFAVHLALHLLLKANYQDTQITFNGQVMTIQRGQHLAGRKKLSEETGIKQSTVRNKLKLLEKTRFLDIKSNNKFSVITICKYEDFQNIKIKRGQQIGQPKDNQRTTKGQPVDTPNEVKEVNEIKKNTPLPPKEELPDWLSQDAWQGFLDMRKAKKKPPTTKALELILEKLNTWREKGHNPTAILNTSIVNSWTDVYEPKETQGVKEVKATLDACAVCKSVTWRTLKSDGGKMVCEKCYGNSNSQTASVNALQA